MAVIQKKVCMLGEFAVGKTSMVRRFVEGNFDDKYLSTVGVKISRKSLQRGDNTLNFLLWDLAGGDNYAGLQKSYLQGVAGAILVCDLTRIDTLEAYKPYIEQVRAVNAKAKFVFAANKADLTDERTITDEHIKTITDEFDYPLLHTSAKTGQNVEEAFIALADLLEKAP